MGKPTKEQVKRYNAKHSEEQRECRIRYARKQQKITEEARQLKIITMATVNRCKCGETQGLIYIKGDRMCGECLDRDLIEPTTEDVAESMSMVGSSAAEFERVW